MTCDLCRIRRRLPALAMMLLPLLATASPPARTALEEARQCTREPARLARLACFDAVFETPVTATAGTTAAVVKPRHWQLAFAREARRQPGDGAIHQDTGERAGHLVTIAALGTTPPRPLLTVQCHNNITELAIMLPRPIAEERLRLTLITPAHSLRQVWRGRDGGYVVSGGRGLPAIATIKSFAGRERLELDASGSRLDGLVFDLEGLAESLQPLRSTCGW